ncbi:MAG: hypothetical protein WB767_08185, partial [Nocardioides sp.]
MPDRVRSVSDRGLPRAIAASALIGVVCIGAGVWGILHPPSVAQPYWVVGAPFGGVVAGAIFLGFA